MKRFVVLYFLFLALLFVLFYAHTSSLAMLLNEEQTKSTLFFLEKFLDKGQLKGIDIWINPHYKIVITQACNGMIPILFFWASVLAYPASFFYKATWVVVGYIAFTMINILRLLFVVYVTQHGRGHEDFYWSHDLLGNFFLMAVGLGIFVLFLKGARKSLS